ncbi:hypothetical protein PENSPDRAFT_658387 [Peniophora sp. CONT]|nr:hypothetical protein PENSPDRAFT_658387 [Peniophora sp. CONT]
MSPILSCTLTDLRLLVRSADLDHRHVLLEKLRVFPKTLRNFGHAYTQNESLVVFSATNGVALMHEPLCGHSCVLYPKASSKGGGEIIPILNFVAANLRASRRRFNRRLDGERRHRCYRDAIRANAYLNRLCILLRKLIRTLFTWRDMPCMTCKQEEGCTRRRSITY